MTVGQSLISLSMESILALPLEINLELWQMNTKEMYL